MRSPVFLALCVATLPSLCGDTVRPASHHGVTQPGGHEISAPIADSLRAAVRVLSHNASLVILPEYKSLVCIDTLTLQLSGESNGSISVRLHPVFSVEETALNGITVPHTFRQGTLSVRAPEGDSVARLTVSYSGTVGSLSEFTRITTDRAILREEEVLPYAQRDLRSGRISITVPPAWSAVTAGNFESARDTADAMIFLYSWTDPIPSIGWICAGRYELSVDRPGNVTVATYRFGSGPAVAGGLASLADSVLSYYGEAFSPYSFDRLSILEVDDWLAGRGILAIAAPGFIMVKRTAFSTDDPYNRVETVLPHEIAHQWWPGTVFVGVSDGAFLSEGLSEYSSMLYSEFRGRLGSRDTLGSHPLLRPLISRVRQGRDVPLSGRQDLRWNPTQYLKSAYVHNMLRSEMGDSCYLLLLKTYAERFSRRTATLEDFERLADEISGKDLGWFFGQWVRRSGIPSIKIYNVKKEGGPGDWRVSGRFRIVGYDSYTVPATIELRTDGDSLRSLFRLGATLSGEYRNDVPFEFVTTQTPLKVVVDPDGDLLKLRKIPEKLGDLRDPAAGVLIVGTLDDAPYLRSIAAGDSAILEKAGWSVVITEDRLVTLGDLQRDRVILYGGPDQNSAVAGLVGSFPIRPGGDSVMIGGETIRDSSLTLIQVVENPHLSNALLIWIAPFGTAARPELRPYDRSWILVRGRAEIASGTWDVRDDNLEVSFEPDP